MAKNVVKKRVKNDENERTGQKITENWQKISKNGQKKNYKKLKKWAQKLNYETFRKSGGKCRTIDKNERKISEKCSQN